MDGPLDGRPTLVMFALPILLSACAGGLRGGLLASVLAYLGASYYLLPPIHSFEQNSYLVTFLLERHGHTVVHAPDGPRAIAMARTLRPDLVLLDFQLPAKNGYAVVRALRALPSFVGVPIIAVTSCAMVGDREKALAAGCNGYIEKPINPETFVAEIAAIATGNSPFQCGHRQHPDRRRRQAETVQAECRFRSHA
jgi:two-component system cell cycle response regulator DivK